MREGDFGGRLGISAFFLFLGILLSSSLQAASDHEPITLQLKWKHQFQFAGFYAAVEKGFYKEAGLDVNLKEANYDTDPIAEVLEGRADYGLANSELALYRLQGHPVTALAVLIQHSPIVLMTLTESNILSPQDLIGKRVMYPDGHYGANTLGIMRREGLTSDQFESIPLSFNLDDLIEKRVDAMVGYVTDQPYVLKEKGVDYRLIDPRTYGIDFYGDTLFTTAERVESNLDQVDRFREASLKGWRYAVENPDEIIDLLLTKYGTQKTRDELKFEAIETIKLIVPELVELGHMNPGRWQHIAETFIDLEMVDAQASLEGFLYEPKKIRSEKRVEKILTAVLVAALVVIAIFIGLLVFNNRLRLMVSEKTRDLTLKNKALVESQALLIEKEEALEGLNKELEQRVADRTQSLELLHQAVANSNSAVMIVDCQQKISYASAAVSGLTGFPSERLLNQPLDTLQEFVELPELFGGNLPGISQFQIYREVQSRTPSGEASWLQISVSPMSFNDDAISHYVIVCEDISDLKVSKDKLEKMALYDALTGLENRTLFNIRLEKAIHRADRSQVKSALLFIDIDHFKSINDGYGHEAGDEVLKYAAGRLRGSVRENDPVARVSGDEFTIILTDIHSYDDASKVAEHILGAFSEPVKMDGREIFVTASIGITVTPDDAMDMDQLIRNADLAMYQAKQEGRNNYQFFCEDMNQEIQRKRSLEIELRNAVENDEFFLLYQPKVCLSSGKLVGVEALIRWRFKGEELRMPGDFIEVAEETGMIVPMGYQVMDKAIQAERQLTQKGLGDVHISINISARQIKEAGFVDEVKRRFHEAASQTDRFELEITESAFIGDNEDGIVCINQLRELGFSISIDDFGTGYSSLSYLQRLPVDTLKIDRSFISELPENTSSAEISRTVIAMAKNMNLEVVAEGVEIEAQASFLSDNQCDVAQGYLYGKPMSLDELAVKFSDFRKSGSGA